MMRYVALLYSIILSPSRRVTSSDLFLVAAHADLTPVRTVLSTGNLIFEADANEAELEGRLEAAVLDRLGRPIPVFVRKAVDVHAICAANPFPEETANDPARVAARIMRHPVPQDVVDRIAMRTGLGEGFASMDRTLWLSSADTLSSSPLIRAAGAAWAGEGTFRNASALMKIDSALGY